MGMAAKNGDADEGRDEAAERSGFVVNGGDERAHDDACRVCVGGHRGTQ